MNNIKYADDTTLMAESEEKGQRKSWLIIQYSKNLDHGICPITSQKIDEETVETVIDFILGSLQNHCSHEIKRCLLLGRKAVTKIAY